MNWLKLTGKSLICGSFITLFLTFACLWTQNKTAAQILLAPLALVANTFSPHSGANPAREATQAMGFLVIFGLLLCILFYSIISFAALLIGNRWRKSDALK